MRVLPLYIFGLTILAGCATGPLDATGTFLPPQHSEQLAKATPCCASYKEMKFAQLSLGQETNTVLSPSSPVYVFREGRSFFAAFELPVYAKQLVVKTYPVNMLWNATGHVLVPGVQFLNAEHQLIDNVKPKYRERNPRAIGRSWAEAEVSVPTSARYVVVLDSKSVAQLAWPDPPKPFLYVRTGPTGEVTVLAQGG